jgi:hypothetical protein
MRIHTFKDVKEAVMNTTSRARIRVSRVGWPIIHIEVPFYRVRAARKLQDRVETGIKIEVSALGWYDFFALNYVQVDRLP